MQVRQDVWIAISTEHNRIGIFIQLDSLAENFGWYRLVLVVIGAFHQGVTVWLGQNGCYGDADLNGPTILVLALVLSFISRKGL